MYEVVYIDPNIHGQILLSSYSFIYFTETHVRKYCLYSACTTASTRTENVRKHIKSDPLFQ